MCIRDSTGNAQRDDLDAAQPAPLGAQLLIQGLSQLGGVAGQGGVADAPMDLDGIRRLYLPLRPKAMFSPGRKTPPGVSAPSAGLRPLNVSCVKCGG